MSATGTRSLPYDPATVKFDPLLRRLNLANTRRRWPELLDQAETQGWSCREFLGVLITEEIAHRQQTRIQRSVRQAHFPFLKTVDEFDFSLQSSLRLPFLGSYLGPELVSGGRSLILQGKSGRGKTHLVIAIAYRAIQNGFTARFVTAASLIETLSVATRLGRLHEALANYLQPHVLVVDEVGYLSYGPDAANVLFHVVNERHLRRRPMLFTTNKPPLTAWGDVLHDHDLAEAIVDRVLERGRLLLLDGPSYRTRHLDLPAEGPHDALHQPARISGKNAADFPEPTYDMPTPRARPDPPEFIGGVLAADTAWRPRTPVPRGRKSSRRCYSTASPSAGKGARTAADGLGHGLFAVSLGIVGIRISHPHLLRHTLPAPWLWVVVMCRDILPC